MSENTEGERIQSLDSLAERQERTESKLDEILGLISGRKRGGEDDDGGKPASVEEQVQAELKRAREDQERAERESAEKAERESTAARLAALEEKAPAPPLRRATRLLGWGDGRK